MINNNPVTSEEIDMLTDEDHLQNDARTKMLYKMLHLYTVLSEKGEKFSLSFLGYDVSFSEGVLNIDGAIDQLQVTGDTFLDVVIGPKFLTFNDFPHDLHQYMVDVFLRN